MPNTALAEFNHLAFQLRMNDIDIHLFDDTLEPEKPDAIFPNNWISTNDSFCRQYASTGKQIKQQPVSAIRTSICITP